MSFKFRSYMEYLDTFVPLELAYQYCIRSPTNKQHYQVLGDLIHSTLQRAIESGIDKRFIERNPIFQKSFKVFIEGVFSQHPNNTVYLSGRLTPD